MIENRIRNPFPYQNTGNRSNGIIQTFNMLDIDGCIYINSGIQQFFYILISFDMPSSGIGMGQLIYQNQLWFPFQRRVNIKLPECNAFMLNFLYRKLFQTMQQGCGLRPCMGFNISRNHIHTALFCLMGSFQHRIGFSYTGSITEKNLQFSPCAV